MLVKLFGSKSRTSILSLFFQDENKKYYIQEIIKLTKTDPANTHRELGKLFDLGILKSKKQANQKYYYLNKDLDYYEGLKKMIEVYNEKIGLGRWINLEEMPNYFPMMVAVPWSVSSANKVLKNFGFKNKFTQLLTTYNDNINQLLVPETEFNNITQEMLEVIIKKPEVGVRYSDLIKKRIGLLDQETKKLLNTNLSELSNKALYAFYKKYYAIYENLHILHWLQTCADFGDSLLSKYLMNYLKEKIDNKKYSLGDVFSALTTPTEEGNAIKEYRNLLGILDYINKNEKLKSYFKKTETRIVVENLKDIDVELDKKLDKHVQKYGWLGYNTIGPSWGKDYFVDILGSLVRQKSNAKMLTEKIEKDRIALEKKQRQIIKDFKIDSTHQKIFKFAQDLVLTKGLRKDSMFFSYYAQENFFKEIGKRYYLSIKQVRYMYPHEFENLLMKNKFSAELLNERYKFSLHYSTGHYSTDKLLEGKKAEEFLKGINIIKEDIENIKILQGDCASPGRVRGKVKIVNVIENMKNMEKGNVLVSIATTPDLVPAIKQASAIVTDAGGIVCHAAIVSREMGIPCVVGTKVATKVLKDGYVVDVDATHGKVNIIKKSK